jgi:hypothetical protein
MAIGRNVIVPGISVVRILLTATALVFFTIRFKIPACPASELLVVGASGVEVRNNPR